jgi:DnaJ-class molecular chaperone
MTDVALFFALLAAAYAVAPTVIDQVRSRWRSRTVAVGVSCPSCDGKGWRGSTAHACPQCLGDGWVLRVGPASELER